MSFVTGGNTIYLRQPRKGDATIVVTQDPWIVVFYDLPSGAADIDAPLQVGGRLKIYAAVKGRIVG